MQTSIHSNTVAILLCFIFFITLLPNDSYAYKSSMQNEPNNNTTFSNIESFDKKVIKEKTSTFINKRIKITKADEGLRYEKNQDCNLSISDDICIFVQ